MFLDTNVLVRARFTAAPQHALARARLRDVVGGTERPRISRQVVREYLAVVTRPQTYLVGAFGRVGRTPGRGLVSVVVRCAGGGRSRRHPHAGRVVSRSSGCRTPGPRREHRGNDAHSRRRAPADVQSGRFPKVRRSHRADRSGRGGLGVWLRISVAAVPNRRTDCPTAAPVRRRPGLTRGAGQTRREVVGETAIRVLI